MRTSGKYKTSLALAISATTLRFHEFDEGDSSFAKNVNRSYKLHNTCNTSTTISVYDDLNKITLCYIMTQDEELKDFLIANKNLISILLEAQVQIEARFGDVPLYLELHTDFENPEWTKIFLIIKNNLSNNDALEKLKNLFKTWFFFKDKSIKRLVTISEESQ